MLINEINSNHEARTPEALARNVVLIQELDSNVAKVWKSSRHSFLFLSCFLLAADGLFRLMRTAVCLSLRLHSLRLHAGARDVQGADRLADRAR